MVRIIFLNVWNGRTGDPFRDFIREHSATTDIFCLQEVYDAIKPTCEDLLPDFTASYGYKRAGDHDDFPQATYVRKGLEVRSSALLLENVPGTGLGLYTEIRTKMGVLHLANVHGVAYPGEKLDNPERIRQSRAMVDFFRTLDGPKVIGGDFNLHPDTESVRLFAEHGYLDLIKEFNVRTTRNRLAWDLYPENRQYHSDYVFTGPGVQIQSFAVPHNEISDHLPLILEIE
ncbi:MAG: hypothetical protein A3C93_01725 [Candidatus Lloydbacteria bacterium RIFCSPHIGHO2_02_FULL_54_17]|uniref:Endonuclease/exonuclease/phosphatase domain-containing protein n=1 Tax=Candidatus Lloydbacteria bacterium RIFCSPHIGHO2_02_FULL_54_17 TaxID=1798664 RepID=A0A1G2DCP0_9BACT|nr:MAG: hypothetical protein A3C93_01725 [Candidatus Lloydbacteria bacterium RIFCSPHIGHO2_02_FULL_54_17]OGZ13711.1 MAG: hypothetical protein A2948_01985 [Candidatus Lloydbacteria bacterium RIFCSPLOWO2_01_FULL_54_18]